MIGNAAHRWAVLCGAVATAIACQVADKASLHGVRRAAIGSIANIASLDLAIDGERLHALLAARLATQLKPSVMYAYSDDDGATWSTPLTLSLNDEPAPISAHGNEVQLAVQGLDLVAVWQATGDVPGAGPMVVAYSRDGGATWRRGANPASGDITNNQSFMDLTVDTAGQFHLVWLDDREEVGNSEGLRYARSVDRGETWLAETTLDASTCTCCWNKLTAIPGAGLAVLYRDHIPHDMRLARSDDGGGRWQTLSAVGDFGWEFAGCPHCGGALAVGAEDGHPLLHSIVWTGKADIAGWYFLRSSDGGASWSKPFPLGNPRSRRADLAASRRELAAIFADTAADRAALSLVRSDDAGRTWSDPVRLTDTADAARQPRVLATTRGFRAFWTEKDTHGRDLLNTLSLN